MGILSSKFKEINGLRFEKFPTCPGKVEKIVRVGNIVVGVGKTGLIYTTCRASRSAAYLPGTWPWQTELLTALVKLGIVDKSIADQHDQDCRKRSLQQHAAYVLDHQVPDWEQRFGIKLTVSQRRKIERVAKPETQ